MNIWQKLTLLVLTLTCAVQGCINNSLDGSLKTTAQALEVTREKLEELDREVDWARGRIKYIEGVLIPAGFKPQPRFDRLHRFEKLEASL